MAHINTAPVHGNNIIFYTDDEGTIWISANSLLRAAGSRNPIAALQSYRRTYKGVGQKFRYPTGTPGSESINDVAPTWHFTHSEAVDFLSGSHTPHRADALKVVEAMVEALKNGDPITDTVLAPEPATQQLDIHEVPTTLIQVPIATVSPAPAKACTELVDWLAQIVLDIDQPHDIRTMALTVRAYIIRLEQELGTR